MNQEAPQQRNERGDSVELTSTLAALSAGTGAKVRLFKSGWVPTYHSPRADFVANEADFGGYAAFTIPTWSVVGRDSDQIPIAFSDRFTFEATDALTPNSIGGLWLEDAIGVLYRFYLFNNPVSMSVALEMLAGFIALQNGTQGYVDVST